MAHQFMNMDMNTHQRCVLSKLLLGWVWASRSAFRVGFIAWIVVVVSLGLGAYLRTHSPARLFRITSDINLKQFSSPTPRIHRPQSSLCTAPFSGVHPYSDDENRFHASCDAKDLTNGLLLYKENLSSNQRIKHILSISHLEWPHLRASSIQCT